MCQSILVDFVHTRKLDSIFEMRGSEYHQATRLHSMGEMKVESGKTKNVFVVNVVIGKKKFQEILNLIKANA